MRRERGEQFQTLGVTIAPSAAQIVQLRADWIMLRATNCLLHIQYDNGQIQQFLPNTLYKVRIEKNVTITNVNGTDTASIAFWYGDGEPAVECSGYADRITNFTGVADVVCGAGATTQIVASTNSQYRVHINCALQATPLRIAGNVTASKGVMFFGGAAPYVIMGRGDLSVYNPTGASVTVSISYESVQ